MSTIHLKLFLSLVLLAITSAKSHNKAHKLHKKDFVFWDAESSEEKGRGPRWMAWDAETDKGKALDTAGESEKEEESKSQEDVCAGVFCHYGRVCRSTMDGRGECVCADSTYCENHKKAVCGSDGIIYPSHCELHRLACIKGRHISVDHSGKRCAAAGKDAILKRVEHVVKERHRDRHHHGHDGKNNQANVEESWEKLLPSTTLPTTSTSVPDTKANDEGNEAVEPVYTTVCTEIQYEQFKGNLMHFHCARIGETNCQPQASNKAFVGNIMFGYYDKNSDERLSEEELENVEHSDHLEKISHDCGLPDMLTFDDKNEDGFIDLNDFYLAFHIATVNLDDELQVFTTQVLAGNSIELKCEIEGATDLIWKRNGAILLPDTAKEIKLFEDHSLYIDQVDLQHTGNYTCEDRYNPTVIQTHVLRVQQPPIVRVSPSTQFHTSGATVQVKCHAEGVPDPEIIWEMNEEPLADDPEHLHYMQLHNNATLEIRHAIYTKDTGAYKCKARNAAGSGQDVGTVFIENSNVPLYATPDAHEVFFVFHDKGYTIYEPTHCHIEHQVAGLFENFKTIPDYSDTLQTLCAENKPCEWGGAVNVQNKFIYISQPKLNRVIVMETTGRSNPLEIIPTDKMPVSLKYVEHLDQVWVLCWNEEQDGGAKTAVVIRQASEAIQHHTLHTQPIANRFDLVKDLFLPPQNNLRHKLQHGYTSHSDQQILYKLDLQNIKYDKDIDLSRHDCLPKSVAFIPLGGQVMIHCQSKASPDGPTFQMTMDYVTNTVLGKHSISGDSYVSPDGRFLVVVDNKGDNIMVNKILDDGKIEHLYDQYTSLHISDVTFFPAERGKSYDFFASSTNKNDVLYMNLATGKIELIEGVGQAINSAEWPWSKHNRIIVSGNEFGQYLMTPSQDSVVVIDGRRRHVQCEWQDIAHGNVIVWVESKLL